MHRYGIATVPGSHLDTHEFTEENTPLHLTHIDAFEIDLDAKQFIGKMKKFFQKQPSFTVLPIADELFGPNKDIPVTLVALSPELEAFHKNLVDYLESAGAVFINPHFLRDQYSPHISIYGPRRVTINEPIAIQEVSIGNKRTDIEDPPNRIIATLPLFQP